MRCVRTFQGAGLRGGAQAIACMLLAQRFNTVHLHAQVCLNKGLDNISMEPAMKQLELTPADVEVPIPPCFIEDRAEVRCNSWPGLPKTFADANKSHKQHHFRTACVCSTESMPLHDAGAG